MKKRKKPKLVTPIRGKLKYNMGTWVDYQLKKKFDFLARQNGHTPASFQRFLMQREVDDFDQIKGIDHDSRNLNRG